MRKCRVCKECNGIVCAGETPGCGGKGNGSTFIRNVAKLKDVRVVMNVVSSNDSVSTESDFFGKKVSLPVYVAPIGGILVHYGADMSEYDYIAGIEFWRRKSLLWVSALLRKVTWPLGSSVSSSMKWGQ